MRHIYDEPQFGEKWFNYPDFYSFIVNYFPTESKFVEVGSWKGMSSAYMAVEIINSGKEIDFLCIDTWEGSVEHQGVVSTSGLFETFLHNMIPVRSHYKAIRTTSELATLQFDDNSLDFVFIDASHEYEDVKNDIEWWLPKIKKDGIISGHDYGNPDFPGVRMAVEERFSNFDVMGHCWYVKR